MLDQETGTPLENAQVYFDGTGGLTNKEGLVQFGGFPSGEVAVTAELLGYGTVAVPMTADTNSGYFGLFQMHSQPLDMCVHYAERPAAVYAIIRDALTGIAPKSGATLVVRDGEFRYTAHAPEAETRGQPKVILGAAPYRPGDYQVSVISSGYREWRSDVTVPERKPGACSAYDPQTVKAWLLPDG